MEQLHILDPMHHFDFHQPHIHTEARVLDSFGLDHFGSGHEFDHIDGTEFGQDLFGLDIFEPGHEPAFGQDLFETGQDQLSDMIHHNPDCDNAYKESPIENLVCNVSENHGFMDNTRVCLQKEQAAGIGFLERHIDCFKEA